jgi:hypothetical protein
MREKATYKGNEAYRGRNSSVIFDSDVIKSTDELRGQISRTRWVNNALREYNERMSILKQKITKEYLTGHQNEQQLAQAIASGERDTKKI